MKVPYIEAFREACHDFLYGKPVAKGPLKASQNGYSSVGGVEFVGVSHRSFLDFRRRNERIVISHPSGHYVVHRARDGYVVREIPKDHFLSP